MKQNILAIFIVAGHSVYNPGGNHEGLSERELVVKITNKLADKLVNVYNIDKYYIGTNENLSIEDKAIKINKLCIQNNYTLSNSLAIEIHTNAGGGTGLEAFSWNDYQVGKDFNNILLQETIKTTGLVNRGAKYERESQYGTLKFIRKTTPLASVFECGFIDHKEDRKILENRIDDIVAGLYNGLADICGFEKLVRVAEKLEKYDFSNALNAIKKGKKVTREGWNGKGLYVSLQTPDENSKMTKPYIYITCPAGNGNYEKEELIPWLASQSDLLANDYMILD